MSMADFKVFLSHSTKDKKFVTKLATELENADITPWLCEVDIDYADNFVASIEKGLKESDIALLVWSPDAARSDWTKVEWTSILARELEESRTRLGFLLLRDAPVPELLRTKHRIDARQDAEKALGEAVQWLVRMRDMRKFTESRAAAVFLDYEPEDFVGRADYFESLHTALVEKPGQFLLHGGPGTGKSNLALKFAWRAQGAFDGAVFQHCGERSAQEIGAELAERLDLGVKELPPEEQIAQAKSWLSKRHTLLVLDDIWNHDVRALVPGPPVSVLFTSRQRSLPWVSASHSTEVKSFVEEEAVSLFRIYLGEETTAKHRDALLQFAAKVEQLPIAVAVGAALLRDEITPLDEAAQKLHLEQLQAKALDVPLLFQRAVAVRPEPERRLLHAMSVCHPEGFWVPLAARIAELEEQEAQQAAAGLRRASLLTMVDREKQRFRLHALMREQLRRTATLDELQEKHAEQLSDLFKDWEARWQNCRECLPEVIPAVQSFWQRGLNAQGDWLSSYGFSTSCRIGELFSADEIVRHEEVHHEELGNKDGLQRSYGNQALILQAWGKLDEAMALHKKQEALCVKLGNKDGLQACYGNQALILKAWGKLDEAMALHKKQEALCVKLGNKDGLQACYGNQALILKAWGKLDEAMALHKKEEALCVELGNKDGG